MGNSDELGGFKAVVVSVALRRPYAKSIISTACRIPSMNRACLGFIAAGTCLSIESSLRMESDSFVACSYSRPPRYKAALTCWSIQHLFLLEANPPCGSDNKHRLCRYFFGQIIPASATVSLYSNGLHLPSTIVPSSSRNPVLQYLAIVYSLFSQLICQVTR